MPLRMMTSKLISHPTIKNAVGAMQAPEGFTACSSEGMGNLMETGSLTSMDGDSRMNNKLQSC